MEENDKYFHVNVNKALPERIILLINVEKFVMLNKVKLLLQQFVVIIRVNKFKISKMRRKEMNMLTL